MTQRVILLAELCIYSTRSSETKNAMSSGAISITGLSSLFEVTMSLSKSFTPNKSLLINFPAVNSQQAAGVTGALLAANHAKHHCFFNERGYHNHIVHHLLALYSLGADPIVINAAYDREAPTQRPIGGLDREDITPENWISFLGQEGYYAKYLKFFLDKIKSSSAISVIEKYIFGKPEGQMFSRSFSGVLHPLIHWGYGLEFKIDGIVAEGLAITAVHKVNFSGLELSDLLKTPAPTGTPDKTAKAHHKDVVPSFDFHHQGSTPIFKPKSGLTIFEILHHISRDPQFDNSDAEFNQSTDSFSKASQHPALASWLEKWEIEDGCEWEEILERTKELLWGATVIYMTTYDKTKGKFMLNFILMHLVTSSLFLPVLLPSIQRHFRPIVLRAFFRTVITIWIAYGRPELRIFECLKEPSFRKIPGSQHPTESSNPWFKILECAAKHPDEHTTKIIRTLSFNAETYGNTKAGYYSCELDGSELLDSTIFLQAAIMTLNKLDWKRKGNETEMKWFE